MKKITKRNLKKLIPSSIIPIVLKYEITKSKKELNKLNHSDYDISNLLSITENELKEIFVNQKNNEAWNKNVNVIKDLNLPEMTGGVNPGDQQAIFYLINHFKPDNVLEIGTHIGCSTVSISLALKENEKKNLTTVDIRDVNDTNIKHWEKCNSKYSPIELVSKIGFKQNVEFVKDNSIHYLANTEKKFDFIFLDGYHNASNVFQEVPLTLKVLNKNGVILLHDYFPQNKPLWNKSFWEPGPYLATQKIISKNKNIKVIPLGKLPWKTKLNSNYTSLAILTKVE